MKLLALLVRIIVFLLTGEWVGPSGDPDAPVAPPPKPQGKASARPVQGPRKATFSGQRDGHPRASGARTTQGSRDAAAAARAWLAAKDELLPRLREVVGGEGLIALLDEDAAALSALVPRAGAGERAALQKLPETLQHASRSLSVVRIAGEQRRDPKLAALLADVDACLDALSAPIYDNAEGERMELPRRRALALVDVDGARLENAFFGHRIAPFVVSRELASDPERWVTLGSAVGQGMFRDVPGWAGELYETLGLPPALMLPPSHAGYDPQSATAAFGVWLPQLFADAFAAFCLGPAYVSYLVRTLSRPKQPAHTVMGTAQGRFLHGAAPSLLRVVTGFRVLTRLGLHAEERTLRERFFGLHGDQESLYLPFDDGTAARIPLSFMLARLDELLTRLIDEPTTALGDDPWLAVPSMGYLHGEHAEAQKAQRSLSAGRAIELPPRILIAGAALSVQANERVRAAVAVALSRSIRGQDTLETVPDAYAPQSKSAPLPQRGARAVGLRSALRDPRAVREAMILGAALGPRRH